jgi:hypothetical protein
MAERKARREPENLVEIDGEETSFVLEPTQIELGCGYTLHVKYDENENPLIDVKTYGQVDIAKLRREIEKMFPNAQIRQMNGARSVTIAKKCKGRSAKKK